MSEIKEFFELSKEIPTLEERLSWQFPRFLEAASRKGRVIIIVDGLHRLRTNDGEGVLRWLPLSFPPNVRIIFSGTLCDQSSVSVTPHGDFVVVSKDGKLNNTSKSVIDRVQIEATRRKWKTLWFKKFTQDDCRHIIDQFILRQVKEEKNMQLKLLPLQLEVKIPSDHIRNYTNASS